MQKLDNFDNQTFDKLSLFKVVLNEENMKRRSLRVG